ncbi:hypothetical protein [Bowmanella denitrificans]|uniref:hypothetical protein n=1 Tax=Bowmanella denitrificans TaxID=366582 RepID=UPI000C9BEBA4|nr:hypothetical protein [Bowmanella denitrificans]
MKKRTGLPLLFYAWVALCKPLFAEDALIPLRMDSPIQPDSPYSLFVGELLGNAYASLGYRLDLQNMPLGRSFLEAEEGRLDGLRDRGQTIAKAYPNLLQVPFPLYDFNLVLLADRRRCGLCALSDVDTLVTLRGFQFQQDYFSRQPSTHQIIKLGDTESVLDMLTLKRVEAAVLTELIVPPGFYRSSPHWIQYPLDSATIYHYLHHKHADLAVKLANKLQEMELTGEVWQLRQKYHIPPLQTDLRAELGSRISAVSANWRGFTDTPEGTYWRILLSALAQSGLQVQIRQSNWKRAKQEFAEGRADILVGAYDFEVPDNGLRSNVHIDYEFPVMAIAHSDDALDRYISGGQAGKACYVLGYEFANWLPGNIEVYEASSMPDCLKLLQNQRVDLLVDYSYNLKDEEKQHLVMREIKEALPLFVVFQNTSRGHLLRKTFEKGFRQLVASGEVAGYFADQAGYRQARLVKPR